MRPYDASKLTVQAFEEARQELVRQGNHRPALKDAAVLLGGVSTSSYTGAVNHVRAVEVFGISPNLAKDEALRRLRLVEPTVLRITADMERAEDKRADPEILADAVSALLIRAGTQMTKYDAGVLAGFLRRDPAKRGATLSALIDFKKWLAQLERALDGSLK
jgi:hypothetical protein